MKPIDWTKVPRGAMTNKGELISSKRAYSHGYCVLLQDDDAFDMETELLRIVPQTRWTYHDGGECPVPDGLTFEAIGRDGEIEEYGSLPAECWQHGGDNDIIAYRITGVDRAGGFTDDPSELTE